MFVALWEFEVKPGCEERFETAYGPRGDWAELFRRHPGYRGTLLCRHASRPSTYLTMDTWTSQQDYEQFLKNQDAAYRQLDAACQALTRRERRIGTYFSVD
jgi:heme-degrading monooxygenase HmoA